MTAWNFACPDWAECLAAGRSIVPNLPLDEERARRAVAIFDNLRLPDVPGQPLRKDAGGPWLRDIVRALFGALDDDGVRHIREVFTLIPKKNDKTTGSSGIMITALLENQRPNAEMIYVGPTQEISGRAFNQTWGTIRADRSGFLGKRLHVVPNQKLIRDRLLGTVLKVKTFDPSIVTGTAPVAVLLDEVHLLSTISYAPDVLGQLRWGMLANPDAFMMMITTQSFGAPAGVFKSELKYARGVRDGRITDEVSLLPVLYEFPESVQKDPKRPYLDPKMWPWVHPNLGRSVTLAALTKSFKEAREKGEDELRRWCGQNLNIQTGIAKQDDSWRGADYWDAGADQALDLDTLIARSEVLVMAVDGGGADDLLGACVIGREAGTGRWLYWFHAWVDRALLALRPEISETLFDFESDGDLTIVDFPPPEDEKAADYMPPDIAGVTALAKRLDATGLLPEKECVGLDRLGVPMMVDALDAAGLPPGRVVNVQQGFMLNGAIEGLTRKLRDGTARHAGTAFMQWVVGNAKCEQRGNAALITKQVSGKAKIDPLIAGLSATMLMSKNPVARAKSVYESRGIRRL